MKDDGDAKLTQMLTLAAQKLWEAYLAAEDDRIREVTMPALDRFIEAVLAHDPAVWHAWGRDLAIGVSDGQLDVPVRFPLFRRVVLPALAEGVVRGIAHCARALASFESLLANTPEVPLPEPLQSAVELLREALARDPADRLARERLVERWQGYLEYTLHELPAGVLYGRDGATIQECGELLELLGEFRTHVAILEQEERVADLVAECDQHFRAYRDYLQDVPRVDSYERFLEAQRSPGR